MNGEIQLTHVHLETPLMIREDRIQTLIVEDPSEFFTMTADLYGQFDGVPGVFVFSRNGDVLSAEKCGAMIGDYFHFDLNEKKTLLLLYKLLERNIFDGEYLPEFNALAGHTARFIEQIGYSVPFALSYAEPEPMDLIKMTGVKFEKTYESLEEKIICYINALTELKKCEFFVLVNPKSVLCDEKIDAIFQHCQSEKIGLLFLEDTYRRARLLYEHAVIITDDLCEILENGLAP